MVANDELRARIDVATVPNLDATPLVNIQQAALGQLPLPRVLQPCPARPGD
ncbi:MAG: hypothetical protein WKG07_41870 [Hymenobacter sp.]